ncbi:asparagine synthase (glutamine-hydrolyzing) [Thermodesulfobacteriota bacterium]
MCGIFGFTFKHNDPLLVLKEMGDLLYHRGPDDEGYYIDTGISMGMRRLSIIDLQHGRQPFFNTNDSVVVICNGEIYNYIELRKELIEKGYHFKTDSDVEVLPYLYDEYGMAFVHKLNGMYAIAIFDKVENEVFLIRDRLGIKPLYYAVVDNNLIFASELKSILATNRLSKQIDFGALSTYLELMYVPVPLTGLKGIFRLPSGAYLKWNKKDYSIISYWGLTLPDETINDKRTAIDEIECLLMDSLRMEMRSDVPVGSFLSGGVDSSAVTALAAGQTEKELCTFHVHWKNIKGKLDESAQAEMVARRYRTRHFVKNVWDEDLINDLPKLIWHLEQPFADGAFVLTYGLAKAAADHVKVILSGAGGDELFGGYAIYKRYPLLKSMIARIVYNKDPLQSYYDKRKGRDSKQWKSFFGWFEPSVYRGRLDKTFKLNKAKDVMNATMLADIEWYLQDDILFLTDKMTMAASIECRIPLLDHRLVELSLKIGSDLKINNGKKKYIFKELLRKYLPNEVLYRPKEGFGAPVAVWVNTYKGKAFDRVLQQGYLARKNLIDASRLQYLLNKPNLNAHEAWLYWKIFILEIWMQLFIEGHDPAPFSQHT